MRHLLFKLLIIVVAFLGLLALTETASAQTNGSIAASGGNGPTTQTDVPFLQDGWVVGPQEVIFDPAAGPWIKFLGAPPGPGNYTLIEDLIVGPGPDWTDWHEEILTPGGDWVTGTIFDLAGNTISGLTVNVPPVSPTIDFFFDPLPPGTQIQINKTLSWNVAGATMPIEVLQYPTTPEPASLALVAGALMGMVVLRRRAS